MQETAGWSVQTVTPDQVWPSICTGVYATFPSPPMQISASASPAS